jgi:streptogramin lyase
MSTAQLGIRAFVVVLLVGLAVGCSSGNKTTGKDDSGPIFPGTKTDIKPTGDTGTGPGSDTILPDDDVIIPDEDGYQPGDDDVTDTPEDGLVEPPEPDATDTPEPENCVDKDNDNYGDNCYLGADCDDTNPYFTVYCPPCDTQTSEGCPCTNPGQTEVCYEGDSATVGIGDCQLGQRSCINGYWSACIGQILPTAEECNDLDDDCDGSVDEGVLSPCGNCDPFCDTLEAGPGTVYPFETDEDNSEGVGTNIDGFLVLDSSQTNLSFIWIANSGEGTVSKLDTETGTELGRYKVCGNPSRTAVDLLGNVYVGCRSDGGVAKIAIDEALCIDKNQNGVIDTSQNSSPMPSGDECILFIKYPGGTCARALGVDKENNPWVGDWSQQTLKKLDSETGNVLDSIPINCNPYGLVIDGTGIIWLSGRGCNKLIRVDPETKNVQHLNPPSTNLYGITVDTKGRVWMGHYSNHGISRYDPETGQWNWITQSIGSHCPRGMAGSTEGFMYSGLGCGGDHHYAKVDIDTLQVTIHDIGPGNKTSVGVAMDSSGHLWAVNYSSSSATKINTANDQKVGEYPVGSSPYTYSDMTGYALHNFTAPQGNYTQVFGGWEEIRVKWTALYIEAEFPDENAYIQVEVRTAPKEEELPSKVWQGKYGPFPPQFFPLDLTQVPQMDGKYLQVRLWLFSKDKLSTPIIKSIQAKFAQD